MKSFVTTALIAVATLGLAACDVDQTEEGSLPDVDVDADGGNLPEYDVEGPEVETGTTTVEVPTVDIEGPDDAEGEPVTGNEE